jgi:hypothetical protein
MVSDTTISITYAVFYNCRIFKDVRTEKCTFPDIRKHINTKQIPNPGKVITCDNNPSIF